jgi:hypothetical protein
MTIPAIISRIATTSPPISAGLLRNRTFSQRMPRAIEITGSAEVIIAWTGARNVPCWKASWLSTKPAGPTTAKT